MTINIEPIHHKRNIHAGTGIESTQPFVGYLGSGIKDGDGNEIFEGDTLEIDFAGVAKLIGDGFLIRDLVASRPTADAELTVEFRNARFQLVWRTKNGGVITGIDLYLAEAIKKFIKVKGGVTSGKYEYRYVS